MKKGFTLAEVLITLGIIGVVAAISIPTLIQKQNENETVAKVRKAYNIMTNAYKMATAEYGTIDKWGVIGESNLGYAGRNDENIPEADRNKSVSSLDTFLNIFSQYIRFNERYDVKTAESSGYGSIYYMGNSASGIPLINYATFADGTMIRTVYLGSASECNNGYCGDLTIDVNGEKGPNTFGKDLFSFHIRKEGISPRGSGDDARKFSSFCNRNESHAYNGYGCSAWIIYVGDMEYLHRDGLDLGL